MPEFTTVSDQGGTLALLREALAQPARGRDEQVTFPDEPSLQLQNAGCIVPETGVVIHAVVDDAVAGQVHCQAVPEGVLNHGEDPAAPGPFHELRHPGFQLLKHPLPGRPGIDVRAAMKAEAHDMEAAS